MLFLLTGDVQIGKTRWLERLAEELADEGVVVAGVVAPGVWRRRAPFESSGEPGLAGAGAFEKLGIDNVLLPQGERVPFARRRDLALAEGTFDPASQSAAAQLAWEISDDAIAQVNAHFDRLMREGGATEAFRMKHSFAQADVSREADAGIACGIRCSATEGLEALCDARRPASGLVVVDELGRLELMRGCGLTSAVALLDEGPAPRFPHALAVVRDWLCPRAADRFAARWGGAEALAPDDDARARVRVACGLDA